MKKVFLASLFCVLSGVPAWAKISSVYECSGTKADHQILVDLLNADSGYQYIRVRVTSSKETTHYVVMPSQSGNGRYVGIKVDPQSGAMGNEEAVFHAPKLQQHKAALEANGAKTDLTCDSNALGGYQAL